MTGAEFKKLRLKLELSQRELAEVLDFSPENGARTIRKIEDGEAVASKSVELAMRYLKHCKETGNE